MSQRIKSSSNVVEHETRIDLRAQSLSRRGMALSRIKNDHLDRAGVCATTFTGLVHSKLRDESL
jgi:hypothetical protein